MAKQPACYVAVDLFAMRAEGLFASLAAASCLTVTLNTSGLSANRSQSDTCKRPGRVYMQKRYAAVQMLQHSKKIHQ